MLAIVSRKGREHVYIKSNDNEKQNEYQKENIPRHFGLGDFVHPIICYLAIQVEVAIRQRPTSKNRSRILAGIILALSIRKVNRFFVF